MNDGIGSLDEYDTPLNWTVIGLRHLQRPDLGSGSYGKCGGHGIILLTVGRKRPSSGLALASWSDYNLSPRSL